MKQPAYFAGLVVHANDVFVSIYPLVYRRCYIRFIRKVNDKKGMEGQEETRKAFDFMLNCVGKLFSFVLFELSLLFCWIETSAI